MRILGIISNIFMVLHVLIASASADVFDFSEPIDNIRGFDSVSM